MLMLLIWRWVGAHDAAANWTPAALAQVPPTAPVNLNWFEQYGPLAVPMALMVGFTWALFRRFERSIDSEREEKLAAQAELRELNKIARTEMMPALTQATAAISEAMKVLRKDHPL